MLPTIWLPLYDILEKQNYGDNKKIIGCQGFGEGGGVVGRSE